MISPRALLRDRRIAPRLHLTAARLPSVPAAWRRLSPWHLVWLILWSPWWVGNELAPPPLPRSREVDMVDPPAGTPAAWLLDTLDDLKFRFGLSWTAALLIRGAWLGGLAGIGWLLPGIVSIVAPPSQLALAILVGIGMVLGLLLRIFHRPRYGAMALLLERAFDLRSRLSTAIAYLRYDTPSPGGLHALQLADAANALDRVRNQLRPGHWVPIREIFIAFVVALTMVLLLVAQRPEGSIATLSGAGVPRFVPVSERLAEQEQAVPPAAPDPATLQEMEDTSRSSNQARKDLETIAGALRGNQQTAPSGDAIMNEDYAGANQRLDEAAPEVTEQSPQEREQLADQLDEAADQVSEQNPELADSARQAADDVRAGEDSGGLGELGDQIERTGEDVIPKQADGGELSDSTSGEQGQSQAGSAGGGEGAQTDQPQPGQQGASESGATGGDPGSGMDASAGVGDSQSGDSGSEGTGSGQGEQQSSASGQGQQPGEAASSDGDGAQDGAPSRDGSQTGGGARGNPDEEGEPAQGAGAGGGQVDANDPSEENGDGSGGGDLDNEEQSPESGQGEAGDPPPGGDGDTGGDQQASVTGGGASVQLPGTSDERVRSGSDIGASSVGSGGGVGAASGDSGGSTSGSAGPDPNVVPSRWRTVVEDYFREGGAP